jgi:hypothetical protein
VLTQDLQIIDQVKKYFPKTNYVYYEDMKRPKGEMVKTSHLYKDDIALNGTPKRTIPEPEKNHILLNLEPKSSFLTWYWCTRSYDFRVDLRGVYDNADIEIGNSDRLENLDQNLETLVKTLSVLI